MARKTAKFQKACAIIARKYGVTLAKVLQDETSQENVYAEVMQDGYKWSAPTNEWELPRKKIKFVTRNTTPVSVRVMTNAGDPGIADIAAQIIVEALAEAGMKVVSKTSARANYNYRGGRVYLDIEI